jgi:hypothetical protein
LVIICPKHRLNRGLEGTETCPGCAMRHKVETDILFEGKYPGVCVLSTCLLPLGGAAELLDADRRGLF